MFFLMLTGIAQFVYCFAVTNYPFNAFIAGSVPGPPLSFGAGPDTFPTCTRPKDSQQPSVNSSFAPHFASSPTPKTNRPSPSSRQNGEPSLLPSLPPSTFFRLLLAQLLIQLTRPRFLEHSAISSSAASSCTSLFGVTSVDPSTRTRVHPPSPCNTTPSEKQQLQPGRHPRHLFKHGRTFSP